MQDQVINQGLAGTSNLMSGQYGITGILLGIFIIGFVGVFWMHRRERSELIHAIDNQHREHRTVFDKQQDELVVLINENNKALTGLTIVMTEIKTLIGSKGK